MATNPAAFVQKENARLKTENDELTREVRELREFVKSLNELLNVQIMSDADLMPLLKDILHKALSLMSAPDGSLALIDEETDELVFVLVDGALSQDLTGFRMPADEGIAGWVVQTGQPALVRDVRRDNRFSHLVDDEFKFRTQSIAAAPLIGNGRVWGMVEALNQPGDQPFSDLDTSLLTLFCRAAGEVLADIARQKPTA